MKNLFKLKNIEFIVFLPILLIGVFFPVASIILLLLTSLIGLFNFWLFCKKNTTIKLYNLIISILLIYVYINFQNYTPIFNILMLFIAVKKYQTNFIKNTLLISLLFSLIMTIAPNGLIVKIINILFILIYLFINQKSFHKWNINNLEFNNVNYKLLTYFWFMGIFANYIVQMYSSHSASLVPVDIKFIFIPLIIFNIIYIVIYPMIKKEENNLK